MLCSHCLRGQAENLDMDNKIIDILTRSVEFIGCLTFSGGEPSLNPEAIIYSRHAMHFNNCSFSCFWLAINARHFKKKFYNAIWDLYCTCDLPEDCVLTISGDQYHELRSDLAMIKYESLPFYSSDRMRFIDEECVINEGIAKENYIGMKEAKISSSITSYDWDSDNETLTIEEDIYVNAKGDVLLSCDLSYESQKKHSIGNVLAEPIEEILIRNLAGKSMLSVKAS